jgi:hypothetical protein
MCCLDIDTRFVATYETDNNRGQLTVRHGDFYPCRVAVIKGSAIVNSSSRDQSEIQTTVRDSS